MAYTKTGEASGGLYLVVGSTYGSGAVTFVNAGVNAYYDIDIGVNVAPYYGEMRIFAAGGTSAVTTQSSGGYYDYGSGILTIGDGVGSLGKVGVYAGGRLSALGPYDLNGVDTEVVLAGVNGGVATINVNGFQGANRSTLTSSADGGVMVFGDTGGSATVDVGGTGLIRTIGATFGRGDGGTGTLTVSGGGSAFEAGGNGFAFADPALAGNGGLVTFGQSGGRGDLVTKSGGDFFVIGDVADGTSAPTLVLGDGVGSESFSSASGPGATINVTQIGKGGGAQDINNGGTGLILGENGGYARLLASNGGDILVTGDGARVVVGRGGVDQTGAPIYVAKQTLLGISNGAQVIIDSGAYGDAGGATLQIGEKRGSNGQVDVSGYGYGDFATLKVRSDAYLAGDDQTGRIDVGEQGYGLLDVRNGGVVEARELRIGVTGYTKDVDGVTTGVITGYGAADGGGVGSVVVYSGASVTVTADGDTPDRGVIVGRASGTTGYVQVGSGGELTSQGGHGVIELGRYGDGSLNLRVGAVNAFDLTVGLGNGSSGYLNVYGGGSPNSTFTVSSDFGRVLDGQDKEAGVAGRVVVGERMGASGEMLVGGASTFLVENTAGETTAPTLVFGDNYGSDGAGYFYGAGTNVIVRQNGAALDALYESGGARLVIGGAGYGAVRVADAAQISVLGDGASATVSEGYYDGEERVYVADNATSELRLQNGGGVTVDSLTFGSDPGDLTPGGGARFVIGDMALSDGYVEVTGVGSTLSVTSSSDFSGDYQTGALIVGDAGAGELYVGNQATASARILWVGKSNVTDDGAKFVRGYGYLADADIDYSGSGVVTVASGGAITVTGAANTPYGGVIVGGGSGAVGDLTLNGGSLTSTGGAARISVGYFGTGAITAGNGSDVNGLGFYIGEKTGADGRAYITGRGTVLTLSDQFGAFTNSKFIGEAGFIGVASDDGSSGYLKIDDGAKVDVLNDPGGDYDNPTVVIGNDNGSSGELILTGYSDFEGQKTAAQLNIIQTGPLGDAGAAGIGVYRTGLVVGAGGEGAAEVSYTAELTIAGAGARLSVAEGRRDDLGDPDTTTAQSTLRISDGGKATVDSLGYGGTLATYDLRGDPFIADLGAEVLIGGDAGANGALTVTGAGSALTVRSSAAEVGDYLNGRITVGANGGKGYLNVADSGATYSRGVTVASGVNATGVATISGGGAVVVTGSAQTPYGGVRVGDGVGAQGRLYVDGVGSQLRLEGPLGGGGRYEGAGQIEIGRQGYGLLDVSNGGAAQGFYMVVGGDELASGRVNIDDAGSSVTLSDAHGSFDQGAGAKGGALLVGRDADAYGRIDITGGGALIVENNAAFAPAVQGEQTRVEIGRDANAIGVINVGNTGPGGDSTLIVRQYGRANDSDVGGAYYGPEMVLGRDGGRGYLNVTGGGYVRIAGEYASLEVGRGLDANNPLASAESLLNISGGGVVTVDSRDMAPSAGYQRAASVSVGDDSSGRGRIVVTGAGSELNILSDNADDLAGPNSDTPFYGVELGAGLSVGGEGRGGLYVESGGAVTINGADDAFPFFVIGYGDDYSYSAADGYARVASGGRVQIYGINTGVNASYQVGVSGLIAVGVNKQAAGELVIATGGQVVNAGLSSEMLIAVNTGSTGDVTVTGAGSYLYGGARIAVGSGIDNASGNFVFSDAGQGALRVQDQAIVKAVTVGVGDDGLIAIDGDGELQANVTLGGVLAPGDQGGIGGGSVTGAVSLFGGSIDFEVDGFLAGQFDTLTTTGAVNVFSGQINIDLSGLATAVDGDEAVLLQSMDAISVAGSAIAVTGDTLSDIDFTVLIRPATVGAESVQQLVLVANGTAPAVALAGDAVIEAPADGAVALTGADLTAAENGRTPDQITFFVSAQSGGHLERATAPGAMIVSFTQADIDARDIRFVDDAPGQVGGSFVVSVTGQDAQTVSTTVEVREARAPGGMVELSGLDGADGVTVNGASSDDLSGISVSQAGDLNNDGVDDVLIAASGLADGALRNVGGAFVVFGADGGIGSSFELSSVNGVNGVRLLGVDDSDLAGLGVSGGGDVNGDGIDDVLVGAYGADPGGRSLAGETYVLFGTGDGFAATVNLGGLNGLDGFRIDGVDSRDQSGRSAEIIDDVNGDGIADIVIGAAGADPNGISAAGESHVVFGSATPFGPSLALSSLNGTNGFTINGVALNDYSGFDVSGAGDVNGDGVGDILVGARLAGSGGASYVVFGVAGARAATIDLSALNGANGFRIDGALGDQSGYSVAAAGDFNGDGLDDIVIGSRLGDDGVTLDTGSAAVVFGRTTGFSAVETLDGLDGTTGFRIFGVDPTDRAGFSVSGAGDTNGDGFDDIIVGAYQAEPGAAQRVGESYVLFGTDAALAPTMSFADLDGTNGFQINGADAEDRSGRAVSGAGDFNNDGLDDVIIGAGLAPSSGGPQAGESYVVYGAASIDPPDQNGDLTLALGVGEQATITAGDLLASEAQSAAADLLYHVTTPTNGFVAFAAAPTVAIDRFTQADVDAGDLIFVHDGSGGIVAGFVFTVTDADGDIFGPASFAVDVQQPPVAFDDAFSTTEDVIITGNLLDDNGEGADFDPNGDTLTVLSFGVPATIDAPLTLSNGVVLTVFSDGAFTLDPNGLNPGISSTTASLPYTISDGNGGTDVGRARFSVDAVNDRPDARDDAFTISEDGGLSATDASVFDDNGFGADSDEETGFTVTRVNDNALNVGQPLTLASGAVVTLGANGGLDYDTSDGEGGSVFDFLAVGETAADSFTYTIEDDDGEEDVATVNITIQGVNDPPVAVDDTAETDADEAVQINLLANDTDVDTAPGDLTLLLPGAGGVSGFADAVLDFSFLGPGTAADPANALGAGDGVFVSLPTGSFITVAFLDEVITDGAGDDLFIGEVGSGGEFARIEVSSDGVNFTEIGTAANNTTTSFDLADIGFTGILSAVRVTGLDAGGGVPGFDLDFVQAIGTAVAPVRGVVTDLGGGLVSFDPAGDFDFLNAGESDTETFSYFVLDGEGGFAGAQATVTVNGANDVTVTTGGGGQDVFVGGAGPDLISGGGGDDFLSGGGGDDTLDGGADADVARGGLGNDSLLGGPGADRLFGEEGDDDISGDDGDDKLRGGSGDDTLSGGIGDDLLVGGADRDNLSGGAGADSLRGNGGADTLDGGAGGDRLRGGSGADILSGGAGQDTLNGGGGADTLAGGIGDDILRGRRGDDLLDGGDGADRFVFNPGDGDDRVLNFEQGVDVLKISAASAFADLAITDDAGDALIAFGNVSVRVVGESAADFSADDFLF